MNPIEQTITDSIEAIHHYDDAEAKVLIKNVQYFLDSTEARNIDPEMREKLQNTLTYLKLIAIPRLTDEETANIIRTSFLDSFDAEIDMENRLTAKLFFVPEIPRDELRKKLKQALLENNQRLGPLTVGQWIAEFEKEYNVKSRNLSASTDFVKNNKNTLTLNPALRNNLRELLYTYDYLLVTTLPFTGPALDELLASDFGKDAGVAVGSTPSFHSGLSTQRNNPSEMRIENLPIDIAMEKYPELGEQLITSSHIKLKIFPEPVRPSIKNWLSDYTFTVGISNHDPIVRGNYIFKGENARLLSQEDRAKLTAILKSFEEKMPLAVNVNTRQIVFSLPEKRVLPQAQNNFPSTETRRMPENYTQPRRIQEPQPRFQTDEERISAWRRNLPQKEELENKPVASNVHFSSPQTFSTEKPPETVRPIQPNYPQKAPTAKINYVAPRPMPKNVVDLREE
jgi:hypothetical protein